MKKFKQILVTGGAGYIGSVLIGKLLEAGYYVRTIDNLSFGGQAILSFWQHPRFQFIKGDITNSSDLKIALEGIEAVIHLAAIVGDPVCKQLPELAVKVNKEGSELLCNIARKNNIQRFIFASTCSNYGKMPDHNGFVNEETALNPVSLYAELKVWFEQFLMNQLSDNFTPVLLRFSTAYGLSPRPRFDLTVNEFTKELFLGRKLEIYGEQFWRPYCHTTDLALACIKALEADAAVVSGRAFNVGDNNENYQKKTLIEMILKELPEMKKNAIFVKRDEDPRDYRVNFDRINTELGFKTSKSVVDGIQEYITVIKTGLIKNPDDKMYGNL